MKLLNEAEQGSSCPLAPHPRPRVTHTSLATTRHQSEPRPHGHASKKVHGRQEKKKKSVGSRKKNEKVRGRREEKKKRSMAVEKKKRKKVYKR